MVRLCMDDQLEQISQTFCAEYKKCFVKMTNFTMHGFILCAKFLMGEFCASVVNCNEDTAHFPCIFSSFNTRFFSEEALGMVPAALL